MSDQITVRQLAAEMGVPDEELLRVAQHLGYQVDASSHLFEADEAESLKSALEGLVLAAQRAATRSANESAPAELNPPAAPISPAAPTPASSAELAQPTAMMIVNITKHDVRVSESYQNGFNNMLRVVAALLADARQTVRTSNTTMPWGDLYFLRADQSTAKRGRIELEYGDDSELGFSQREKGILGDIWWSARWLTADWTRPFQKLLMTAGVMRDPERDYRNQLESDLLALEAQGMILGLEEWQIDTSLAGRNIHITPKPESVPGEKK